MCEQMGRVCELRGDENHGQASRPDRILSMNRNNVCQGRTVSPLVSVWGYVTITDGLFITAFIFLYYSEDRVIEHYENLKGLSRGQAIVQ